MKPDQRLGDDALPQLTNWRSSLEPEIRDTGLRSMARRFRQTGRVVAPVWISKSNIHVASSPMKRKQLIRKSVLLSFCDQTTQKTFRPPNLSQEEWSGLLRWLDVSGLALYFLDRMMELQSSTLVPPQVLARLEQNLKDNQERTAGLIEESVAIQQDFQGANLCYAMLKGFSLSPHSVPRPELRHQFDLDFLVAEKSAAGARKVLEFHGYRLHAMSGRSWEFKRDDAPGNIRDLYKNVPCRSVELHLETETPGCQTLLERAERREFHGISMPVLSSVDLLIGQGLHAYKHICSEFSRTSHLLEFRRHVLSRCGDASFWKEVQSRVESSMEARVGLGVVTLLITSIMGEFAPEAFTNSTVGRLPSTVCLWVNLYGPRIVFGDASGSKLYLLLQRELENEGVRHRRTLRQALLPSRFPPPVVRGSAGETLRARMSRYRLQIYFVMSRLRFHVVEGLRYVQESYRWRRHVNRVIG
ncbi:MAG TPA: nucleotidyltransferase family protein [Acidobacteriaceae bacterium]|jgi:hypothetical protein|nr:nucleotidyltransferase family protein [Acidobacteriaceae bacterium]